MFVITRLSLIQRTQSAFVDEATFLHRLQDLPKPAFLVLEEETVPARID